MHSSRLIISLRGAPILLAFFSLPTQRAYSQRGAWRVYTDTIYGYAFNYPAPYEMRDSFNLTDGRVRTMVHVEDWTRPVTRGDTKWEHQSLAAERAEVSCMADGPTCSTSCKVRSLEEVPNLHGVRVVAVRQRRFDTCKSDSTGTIDPVFIADLSGAGVYYLLIFHPMIDEPGVPVATLRSIVATIRRVKGRPR